MNLSKTFKWRIQKDNVDQVTYESSLENKISNPIKHPNPEYLTDINTSYKKVETITDKNEYNNDKSDDYKSIMSSDKEDDKNQNKGINDCYFLAHKEHKSVDRFSSEDDNRKLDKTKTVTIKSLSPTKKEVDKVNLKHKSVFNRIEVNKKLEKSFTSNYTDVYNPIKRPSDKNVFEKTINRSDVFKTFDWSSSNKKETESIFKQKLNSSVFNRIESSEDETVDKITTSSYTDVYNPIKTSINDNLIEKQISSSTKFNNSEWSPIKNEVSNPFRKNITSFHKPFISESNNKEENKLSQNNTAVHKCIKWPSENYTKSNITDNYNPFKRVKSDIPETSTRDNLTTNDARHFLTKRRFKQERDIGKQSEFSEEFSTDFTDGNTTEYSETFSAPVSEGVDTKVAKSVKRKKLIKRKHSDIGIARRNSDSEEDGIQPPVKSRKLEVTTRSVRDEFGKLISSADKETGGSYESLSESFACEKDNWNGDSCEKNDDKPLRSSRHLKKHRLRNVKGNITYISIEFLRGRPRMNKTCSNTENIVQGDNKMQSLIQYFIGLRKAIHKRNGYHIAKFLSLRDLHVMNRFLYCEHVFEIANYSLKEPWNRIAFRHLRCMEFLRRNDYYEIFLQYYKIFKLIFTYIKRKKNQKERNWFLPIFIMICNELRMVSIKADILCEGYSEFTKQLLHYKPGRCVEKAIAEIMRMFRYCATDMRTKVCKSRRLGMLPIVNCMIRIYIKMDKLHLCKAVIRAIDHVKIKEYFTKKEMATYYYFCGKRNMHYSDFDDAEKNLEYAFKYGDRRYKNNMSKILRCLIPIKILHGKYPGIDYLKKYHLQSFFPICRSVRNGNIGELRSIFANDRNLILSSNMHLLWSELSTYTFRNLIKSIAISMDTTRIKFTYIFDALKFVGATDISDKEAISLCAILIYTKRLKAYISTKHMTMVILRRNFPHAAFPEF